MDVYELIRQYDRHNPNGHYFDHDTLKFFGERLSDMRVLKDKVKVRDSSGNEHIAYCLSSLQRNHPCGKRRKYSYFDHGTFEQIIT